MNRRRGCIRGIAVSLAVLAALACLVLGAFAGLYIRQQQAQAQFEPPGVTITDPASGASVLADSYMAISATAFGSIPITRVELWVDGQLVDTQESRAPEGISPFDVSFDLMVPQGLHTVFVRAVNAMGIVGDSWPVNVGGVERPGADDPARVVTVEEGQTLDDIAAAYDADPETVRQLNPGLGDQEPPPGSELLLPPPQSAAVPGPGGPPVGPTLPPSPGPPPAAGPLPPPTGTRLGYIRAMAPISIASILDIVRGVSTPAAPTDLQAEVTGCNIHLRWKDNADNEERYEVWYLWNRSHDPRVIGELDPAPGGQVWLDFPAPSSGAFIFWVEAVNFWGSQPSNKVEAQVVEGDCPQTLATHLQVEALDAAVPTDQVYCYLSVEGPPHIRVPDQGFLNDFEISALWGDNFPVATTVARRLVVPIPGDGSLEVAGECEGWPGGKYSKLGPLSGSYPSETWDGTRLTLQESGLEIGLSIKPMEGALDTSGAMYTFGYEDPDMPYPYDVFEDMVRSFNPVPPLTRLVVWKWDGDPNTISGFQILLNGAPYNVGGGWSLVAPTSRSARVTLPRECGGHITWQVRAIAGQTESRLSDKTPRNDYDLPPCPEHAMVTFDSITFKEDCDFDASYLLEVNGQNKQFYETCDYGPWDACLLSGVPSAIRHCGPHSFWDWGKGMDPHPDTIVVPIPLGEIDIGIKVAVADRSDGHVRAAHWVPLHFSSLEEAQEEVGCAKTVCDVGWWSVLCYRLYIFPQAEPLSCVVTQPAYTP